MTDIDMWSEATLYSVVVDLARRTGWLTWHDTDSRRNRPGFPDLVLLHLSTGRLKFRELKTAKGKVRPEQTEWLTALGKRHDAGIWRPSDWAEGVIQDELTNWRAFA